MNVAMNVPTVVTMIVPTIVPTIVVWVSRRFGMLASSGLSPATSPANIVVRKIRLGCAPKCPPFSVVKMCKDRTSP